MFLDSSSPINPFRTAVPFGDKTTLNLTGLSPERDCGSKRVNSVEGGNQSRVLFAVYVGYDRIYISFIPGNWIFF